MEVEVDLWANQRVIRDTDRQREEKATLARSKDEQIRKIGWLDESIQWWLLHCDRKVFDVYLPRHGD